jgi:hypothetical protein
MKISGCNSTTLTISFLNSPINLATVYSWVSINSQCIINKSNFIDSSTLKEPCCNVDLYD